MKLPHLKPRTWAFIAVIIPLVVLFIYVALRSGPLAPIAVTVGHVESRSITPAIPGVGTVQARFTYKVGPTVAGRVKYLNVNVGDTVKAGQLLGEMDAVDLDERMSAAQAAIKSSEAAIQQVTAKEAFAQTQATRYEKLFAVQGASEEIAVTKRQEATVASAALAAAREENLRLHAELAALRAQRGHLRLVAPADGLVTMRDAEPGTTVVAGQAVVELIDPASMWIDTRFDQISSEGLTAGLPATVVLKSRRSEALPGQVIRIEPRADAITEETLGKIAFRSPPTPLPPLGELAEITVQLRELPATPTISNAAIRTINGQRGVWRVVDGHLAFTPITLGRSGLDGMVQVLKGLSVGEIVVIYSDKTLNATSRVDIVQSLTGAAL